MTYVWVVFGSSMVAIALVCGAWYMGDRYGYLRGYERGVADTKPRRRGNHFVRKDGTYTPYKQRKVPVGDAVS